MARQPALIDPPLSRGAYVVRAPRAGDALAGSLRRVFEADPRLPSDLATLLQRLERPRAR